MRESSERRRWPGAIAIAAVVVVAVIVGACSNPANSDDGGGGTGSGTDEPETYNVGETGPAGGIVFYDKGAYSDGWRYLEAAPDSTEWTFKPWGGFGTEIGAAAQGTGIGTGAANTQAIVAEYGANEPDVGRADYAAKLAADLLEGGYDDWFLPSQDELDLMDQNLHDQALGGFASSYYWSSSENGAYDAWRQYFDNGDRVNRIKHLDYRVRAARAF